MNSNERKSIGEYLLSGFNGETFSASLVSYLFSAVCITPLCFLLLRLTGEDIGLKVLPFFVFACIASEFVIANRWTIFSDNITRAADRLYYRFLTHPAAAIRLLSVISIKPTACVRVLSRWFNADPKATAWVLFRWSDAAPAATAELLSRWFNADPAATAELLSRWFNAAPEAAARVLSRWSAADPKAVAELLSRWSAAAPAAVAELLSRWSAADPAAVAELL